MAETYVRGRITALNMIEGDTDKGHWARQEAGICRPTVRHTAAFTGAGLLPAAADSVPF